MQRIFKGSNAKDWQASAPTPPLLWNEKKLPLTYRSPLSFAPPIEMSALGQKQTCAAHKPMSAKCQ